jgi:hypothetical protein
MQKNMTSDRSVTVLRSDFSKLNELHRDVIDAVRATTPSFMALAVIYSRSARNG